MATKQRFDSPLSALQFISRQSRNIDEDNRNGIWKIGQPISLRVNAALDYLRRHCFVTRYWNREAKQGYAIIEGTNKF